MWRESKHSLKYLTCLRMTWLLFNIIIPPLTSPEEHRRTTGDSEDWTDISPAALGPDCHAGFLPHIVRDTAQGQSRPRAHTCCWGKPRIWSQQDNLARSLVLFQEVCRQVGPMSCHHETCKAQPQHEIPALLLVAC